MPHESIPNFDNSLALQLLLGFGSKLFEAKLAGKIPPRVTSTVQEYINATPVCTEEHVRDAFEELRAKGLAILVGNDEYMPTPKGLKFGARLSA